MARKMATCHFSVEEKTWLNAFYETETAGLSGTQLRNHHNRGIIPARLIVCLETTRLEQALPEKYRRGAIIRHYGSTKSTIFEIRKWWFKVDHVELSMYEVSQTSSRGSLF